MRRAILFICLLLVCSSAFAVEIKIEGVSHEKYMAIAGEISDLFEKVQDLLFMDVSDAGIKVVVFEKDADVKREWESITGKKCENVAFYHFNSNTVYMSRQHLRRGIVAHELAHAVLANYFGSAPEEETDKREAIARWVEREILK